MPRVFYLFIADHDKRQFNRVGPMRRELPWTLKVNAAQDAGRKINCTSPEPSEVDRTYDYFQKELGYEETFDPLVEVPEDADNTN